MKAVQLVYFDLHSIMYLLIPVHPTRNAARSRLFTFHNVSINSPQVLRLLSHYLNLHSIMYLLIRILIKTRSSVKTFTFHNVSINSDNGEDRMKAVQHLHSIMYLLIR